MSKDKKTEVSAPSRGDRAKAWGKKNGLLAVDYALKGVATAFVLMTSFSYVRDWLQSNQVNHDFSLVGAILVMSVALYLIVRKR